MTNWMEEKCASQPDELQIAGPNTFVQRRDIHAVVNKGEDEDSPEYIDYECECRFISESEKAMLDSIEEIETNKAIDEYTMQLIEEGIL